MGSYWLVVISVVIALYIPFRRGYIILSSWLSWLKVFILLFSPPFYSLYPLLSSSSSSNLPILFPHGPLLFPPSSNSLSPRYPLPFSQVGQKKDKNEEEKEEKEKEEEEGEEMCVSAGDPISVVCVDQTTGHIVAGAQNNLKYNTYMYLLSLVSSVVFSPLCRVYNRDLELLQVSRGHTDSIRALIHIPDRKQVHM